MIKIDLNATSLWTSGLFIVVVLMINLSGSIATNENPNVNRLSIIKHEVAPVQLRNRRPHARVHTANQTSGIKTTPANRKPAYTAKVSIKVQGQLRVISSNSMPTHPVGAFPNRGNPHRITPQNFYYRIEAYPKAHHQLTPLTMSAFGIAVNGVLFEPGAAEWYLGKRKSSWRYEALAGAVPLGLDANYAHVQPSGKYHYHGMPTLLLRELGIKANKHSPLVGWSADGFPMYALYGYSDPKDPKSKIKKLTSSYQIKKGYRNPAGNHQPTQDNPGGTFDGTFTQDYVFIQGAGDLDACNGRFTVTPEFPGGTYAYFLTEKWPVIPRYFRALPAWDFLRRP